MEVVVNKKNKPINFFNKLSDFLALLLVIVAVATLLFNLNPILKLVVFLGLLVGGAYIFFFFGR